MPSVSFRQPVFFDPHGWRKHVFRTIGLLAALLIVGPLLLLIISIVNQPVLPQPEMPAQKTVPTASPGSDLTLPPEPEILWSHARSRDEKVGQKVLRYGFLVNWDDNSLASLKQNAAALDVVIAEWLHVVNGTVSRDDQRREREVLDWRATGAPELKILPLVNNFDKKKMAWDSEGLAALFSSAEAREAFVARLHTYVREGGFGGIVLGLEEIPAEAHTDFVTLTRELAARFHGDGMKVLVVVPARDIDYDYETLAETVDQLIVVAHDEHASDEQSGPLAGQGWFEAVLDERFKEIDGNRLIVRIASHGYDWNDTTEAREISIQEAWKLLDASGGSLYFDPRSMNPGFTYVEGSGQHDVWLLDGVTAYNQVAAALAMEPAGLALWRLGTEDPAVWSSFGRGRVPDDSALAEIETIKPGYAVAYQGEGEALRIISEEQEGRRKVDHSPAHKLITDESIVSLPKTLTVSRWGKRQAKLLALTFDDGPDPVFTPPILDILVQKGVKASFFVLGSQGNRHPDLLKRIYDEGHDIGSHTYSHADLDRISDMAVELELNATSRLIEARLGVTTSLFRPPFARNMEPMTIDQARPLRAATRHGYTTVGLKIDPYDWAMPDANEIVRRVLAQVSAGKGNIILLHDAGGDRKETVLALPRIIDALRGWGYKFVTVHELLKVPREAVMPAAAESEGVFGQLNEAGFRIVGLVGALIGAFCVIGLTLGTARLVLVAGAALIHKRRERRRRSLDWTPPSLAVLIPAYNEETVICGSIRTVLASEMQGFEILVIDDGSSDRTAAVARAAFVDEPRVKVITKPNGGKAAALNFGLSWTNAEIVVVMDADTIFMPDALHLLTRHFGDPKVGAAAGSAVVGNRINLITRFQALEYLTSQNLDRRALELVNAITVVPGAIGAWRRSALLEIGGFPEDTLAEDADATISLERARWIVLYEPRAIARTEAPESFRAFLKQRFRWMFGTLQAGWKHRDAIRQRGAPGVAWCALPNIVLFQFTFALISPAMDAAFVWDLIVTWRDTGTPTGAGLSLTAGSWIALQGLELAVAAVALSLDRERGTWILLPLVVVQRFCYRQLIYLTALRTALAAIEGRIVGWGKLRRTGQVLARASALVPISGSVDAPISTILSRSPAPLGLPAPAVMFAPISEPAARPVPPHGRFGL